MLRNVLLAGFVLALPVVADRARAADFDGRWSVLIVTEKGDCDRGYRYEVNVGQGRVVYAGDAAVGLDGTVAPDGSVKVSIGNKAGQHAQGTGRLAAKAGRGTWRSDECAGTWEAERR